MRSVALGFAAVALMAQAPDPFAFPDPLPDPQLGNPFAPPASPLFAGPSLVQQMQAQRDRVDAMEAQQRSAALQDEMNEPEEFHQQLNGSYLGTDGSLIVRHDPMTLNGRMGTNSDGEPVHCAVGVCH